MCPLSTICEFADKKISMMYIEVKIKWKGFVKKKIISLTNKELESCDSQENVTFAKKVWIQRR